MRFLIGSEPIELTVDHLIVAGWTGRNADSVQHHIDELNALGVSPPSTTPLFYQVSSTLLTQAPSIQVLGEATSGEAEPLLVAQDGKLWLGLGSDHTDRDLETTSVAASKQACLKVCATELWEFEAIKPHVDQLKLRSWIKVDDDWTLYQDGTLEQILPLGHLAAQFDGTDQAAMLCGTLPAIKGVRTASEFRASLSDPVLGKSIELEYRAECLRIVH